MRYVFVLNADKQPLDPVHPGRARLLLTQGKAAVFRHQPFTIIMHEEVQKPTTTPLRLKIDPGSKTTGLAIVNDATGQVVWAAELAHRGEAVKARLIARRALRRNRRCRKTRHRPVRFKNRRRPEGWLPPSLESRVANITTWVERLRRWCPIATISVELAKFDTQLMDNPDISGVEYQQGTLAGYEAREWVLESWSRQCAYCGKENVPLQMDHIIPRGRGSDRVRRVVPPAGRGVPGHSAPPTTPTPAPGRVHRSP